MRATGSSPLNFRPLLGELALLGMPAFMDARPPTATKRPRRRGSNPDAMMRRLQLFATALGTGRLPIETPPPEGEPEVGFVTKAAMSGARPGSPDHSTRSV